MGLTENMTLGKKAVCALCDKPQAESYKPFCSARCKLIDLGNWMNGGYKLSNEEAPSQAEILDLSDYLSHKRQQF